MQAPESQRATELPFDLNDDDRAVRSAGLLALWSHGSAADVDALLQRLERETDSELLEMVVDTLSVLECTTAVPALLALGHNLSQPPEIRRAALNAAYELAEAI